MSDAIWSRLSAPFGGDAVAWVPVEVSDGGDEVRVLAILTERAVRERFDRTVGIAGWGVAYAPLDAGAVACHLTVAGVTKGAVAAAALTGGPMATAETALARAAELFGMRPPGPAGASAWVACDPETLTPLHPPEVDLAAAAAPSSTMGDARGAAAPVVPPSSSGSPAAASATPASSGSGAPAASADPSAVGAPTPVEKPTGQQMIDRLVDRLKDEGQGLEAARLLVRYGGYGKDPETARELYARLRALLRGEAVAAGGGAA